MTGIFNTKHTEGPWEFHEQGDANEFVMLTTKKRWLFAFRQNGEMMTEEQMANCRLVRASPELLKVAIWVYLADDAGPVERMRYRAAAKEAIDRALGDQK